MKRYKISLDWEEFDHKPGKAQYKDYKNKVTQQPIPEVAIVGARVGRQVEELSILQLAAAINKGQTWSPHIFSKCPLRQRRHRQEGLWESCQLVGLDFDRNTSTKDILAKFDEHGIKPALLHKSFSWSKENNKLRAVVAFDTPFQSAADAKIVIVGLQQLFSEEKPDPACKDLARIFFGGLPRSTVYIKPAHSNPLWPILEVCNKIVEIEAEKKTWSSGMRDKADWGIHPDMTDGERQEQKLKSLKSSRRKYLVKAVSGLLEDIRTLGPNDGKARHTVLWNSTARMARFPEIYPASVRFWVSDAVYKNSYFDEWDKDIEATIENAIMWAADKLMIPDEN